jgi:hypothetical protein
MDWRIPEKLKKGVSYARFSITLRSMNGNVKVSRPESRLARALAGDPTTVLNCANAADSRNARVRRVNGNQVRWMRRSLDLPEIAYSLEV